MKVTKSVSKLYRKVKLVIYKSMLDKLKGKEEELSSTEYFCLECIYLMGTPTVSQFANFFDISSPNATYKIKQLIKKGFLTKEKSDKDKREFLLKTTDKFLEYYERNDNGQRVMDDLAKSLDKAELEKLAIIAK